jgi:signal peptidase
VSQQVTRALWRGGKTPSSQAFSPTRRGWISLALSGALFTLVIAVWIIAAPTQLGGLASYVVVTGNSMEPNLHDGDLAIVRLGDQYLPGDIVAYRHPDIGPVIHRIQTVGNDRFVFQGDNNTWVDSYNPAVSELIGGLWLQVPHVGVLMEATRNSGWFAILGGLGGAIILASLFGSDSKQKNRKRQPTRPVRSGAIGENAQSLLAALGMALAGFTLLGFFSFAQPVDHAVQKDARYEQSGTFSYGASVPGAAAYDAGRVTTGDPVFRKLASRVDVAFAYHFASQSPSQVSGVQRLIAVVTDTNGWKRTLPLTTETPFEGDSFTAQAVLDLDRVQAVIDSLETETGIKRDLFEVAVVPEVQTTGTVAGQPFAAPFTPRLKFRVDPLQLQMLPAGPQETDPRSPSESASVKVPQLEANTLPVLGARLNIAEARRLALLGIALCVVTGLGLGLYLLRRVGSDEPARIEARLGSMLVSVHSESPPTGRIVNVETIEDLAKVAERTGGMVLHEVWGDAHQYLVEEGETTYHYRAFARQAEASTAAAEIAAR